ncbi:MAG: MATE family efflux transporter [Gemmatimonadota bacterium]|nr:MATE family efflux transporter [Gemmatimonadota bacterium]
MRESSEIIAAPPVETPEPDHLGGSPLGRLSRLSFPLILNSGSVILMFFCDRMFLSWYGTNEISAVWPATFLCWGMTSFFYSTGTFVNVFVAQYFGAGNRRMCAATVWQGVYFTLGAWLVLLALIAPGRMVFDLFGHRPEIAHLEKIYFTVMISASVMPMLNNVLAGFFTGRGRTHITMAANIIGNVVNVGLDWVLIFGNLGAPRLGILGAALATAIASLVPVVIMGTLFLSNHYQKRYQTRHAFRLRWNIIARLFRTGAPSGFQDMMSLLILGLFFMFMGRTLPEQLAGNNIAWSINDFLTLYVHGIVLGVCTLTAQYIGGGRTADAQRVIIAALKVLICCSVAIAGAYLLFSDPLIWILRQRETGGSSIDFALILPEAKTALLYLAAYNILFGPLYCLKQALRGAGDTRFFLKTAIFLDLLFFIPGIFLVAHFFGPGMNALWNFLLIYLATVTTVYALRVRSGKWRTVSVVDLEE